MRAAAAAACGPCGAAPTRAPAAGPPRTPGRPTVLAPVTPSLRAGDRVALIAPASPPGDAGIALALENVRALGLEPVLGAHARAAADYLAGSDEERAADFNAALRDPSIRGIIALRGGYGTMRILDALDYAQLARDPKCIVGYSDLTAPLNAFAQRSNVVTFHAPIAGTVMTAAQYERLKSALFLHDFALGEMHALVPGSARGVLRGGNLSLIAALCGTPYAIEMQGAILVLEDVDEAPYRIDRLLVQLHLAGALAQAAGFAIGDIPAPQVAHDWIARYNVPAASGIPVGHILEQAVIPIGAQAELDVDAGRLRVR